MTLITQADRESSATSQSDNSSSGSCIVLASPAKTTSTAKSPLSLVHTATESTLNQASGTRKTTRSSSRHLFAKTSPTDKATATNQAVGAIQPRQEHKAAQICGPSELRRKSSRISSITKAAADAITLTATVLGKRSRDATDAIASTATAVSERSIDALKKGKAKLQPDRSSRDRSLRLRKPDGTVSLPKQESIEPPTKKLKSSPVPSSSAISTGEDEVHKLVSKYTRPSTKKYLASGLYVGQASDFDARLTEKQNQRRRASGKIQQVDKPERKILPLPMFNGKRLLETGRLFKLPFDVFSPLPPGQAKPDEWRKTQSNRFVGESALEWKKLKPLEASRCQCKPESGCDEDCQNRYMLYECDETNCNIGANLCTNRPFAELKERHKRGNKYDIGVEVIKTLEKGFGVRSNRTFEPHQIIVEYAGEIITQEEAERRMVEEYKNNDCYYLMEFDQNMIIDGTRGSIARFVNHSCAPNCTIVKWIVAGKPRMALFAGEKGIMTGEELTYDYNFDPFSQKNVQACKCGAPTCRGVLGPKPKDSRESSKTTKKENLVATRIKRNAEKIRASIVSSSSKKKKQSFSSSSDTGLAVVTTTSNSKTSVKRKRSMLTSTGSRSSLGKENVIIETMTQKVMISRKTSSGRIEKRRHTLDTLSRTTSSIKRATAALRNSSVMRAGRGPLKPSTIDMYFNRT